MRNVLLMLALAGSWGANTGHAVEVSGVVVPDTAGELPLKGSGLLRWKWVFKIYVGALYLPAGTAETAVLTTTPKRLAFTYRRDFSSEDLRKATDATIFRGLQETEMVRLKPLLAIWNAGYPAVVEGDCLTIDHRANDDLILAVNGQERARVKDGAFAQAMFGIWLGPQAISDSFKAELLGR